MTNQLINDYESSHYKDMLYGVIPLIICGTALYGLRVLLICVVAMLTARTVDVIVSMLRGQEFDTSDYSAVLSAVIFSMLLPVNIPLYIIIITVGFTTLVGKHLFGGKGVYPFNLTALSMCISVVNWPKETLAAVVPFSKVEFWSGAANSTVSNAAIIKDGGIPTVTTFNMLLGNYPGVIGADFILVVIAVAVFFYINKRVTWHIPVAFLLTCIAFSFFFPRVYGFSRIDSVKFELLNGALIFCSIFLMNEPATTPKNPKAKIIFGVLAGVLTMLFKYFGSYEIGVCFALLLVNTIEGFIDRAVEKKFVINIKEIKKASMSSSQRRRAAISENRAYEDKIQINTSDSGVKTEKLEPQSVQASDNEARNFQSVQTINKESKKLQRIQASEQPANNATAARVETENAKEIQKPEKKKPPQNKRPKGAGYALDLINEAEDSIDQILYSTRTIDVAAVLEEEKRRKAKKEGVKKSERTVYRSDEFK